MRIPNPDELPGLLDGSAAADDVEAWLTSIGFGDWRSAWDRLQRLSGGNSAAAEALANCLPPLLFALSDAATADGSLVNFERFVNSVDDRAELFAYLASNPRAVEILVRLFVGSQFLTGILLRNPDYLRQLTQHKGLAEFKSRQQFRDEGLERASRVEGLVNELDELRRFQHWELLRIGACDSFGLMDLKSVTVQLSLLADALVQACLTLLSRELELDVDGFCVIAFGKLGGEELNYSSDIDLVFLARSDATRFWTLGQKLIASIADATAVGFLYRVDMRLRPWGRSGALVNTLDAHVDYLHEYGQPWERQALLKARCIAGDESLGEEFCDRVDPLIFEPSVNEARENARAMKTRIEEKLERDGRGWGEVKSGAGSIRDIEFTTQFLQLAHGRTNRAVKSINTLDALVRLADHGFLQADEYRRLSSGYVFLRTIEHALQLMHHEQTHTMPDDPRELAYLARRLDYPDAEQFLLHYQRHTEAIRSIYERYVVAGEVAGEPEAPASAQTIPDHAARMQPSYSKIFDDRQIEQHAAMLGELSDEQVVRVATERLVDGRWRVTIAGFDHIGDLAVVCGLLYVYGFNIVGGNAFSQDQLPSKAVGSQSDGDGAGRMFVDVFDVEPPLDLVLPEVWERYEADLGELTTLHRRGEHALAHGQLAKRVAGALRDETAPDDVLYPLEVEFDNEASPHATVLHIRGEDTRGFLYALANSLSLTKIDVGRLIVRSVGNTVFDTLYVTDPNGEKLQDEKRLQELRAAIVLIAHFSHLLPKSPNPESALAHFNDFLQQLFKRSNWVEEITSLERSDVLGSLATVLGVSDFLWEDFLRLQHDNLFPVVSDPEGLAEPKTRGQLEQELAADSWVIGDNEDDLRRRLNEFKDREIFRIDMRHILGLVGGFGAFASELTDLAEVVVDAARRLCNVRLRLRYGIPRLADGRECPLVVAALGKCGGRELGYASDIELMFVYEDNGSTDGGESITNAEYFQHLVERFTQTIRARQEGIFQIDLRLRPYGRAGSLAVSLDAFEQYFHPDGPAWPYERQALVKLRPISGDLTFGRDLVALRDDCVYTGVPFDVTAMRGMREKQVNQLVKAGTFNAKLGTGGLVDAEYLVQALQITHGRVHPELRVPNTREAATQLERVGILTAEQRLRLRSAYVFLRRLIDALRVVRGNARDLTVPAPDDEEFEFLARRLEYGSDLARLQADIEVHRDVVLELSRLLERIPKPHEQRASSTTSGTELADR